VQGAGCMVQGAKYELNLTNSPFEGGNGDVYEVIRQKTKDKRQKSQEKNQVFQVPLPGGVRGGFN